MKRALPIVLAGLAIAALLGALHLLQSVPEPEKTQRTDTAAVGAPLQVLVDQQDAPAIEVVLSRDGETTAYVHDGQAYRAKDYDRRLEFDQILLRNLFDACTRLVSRKVIEEQPDDVSVYGLETPGCMVSVTYADGKRHTIRIGSRSPLEDGYFGTLDEEPAVQMFTNYDVDLFKRLLADYRAYSLFHELGDEAEAYALTVREMVIDRGEQGRLSVYRAPDSPNGDVSNIRILEPVEVDGSEYDFMQKLVVPLLSLSNAGLELVEDLPDDLGRYGLNTPRTLLLRDDGGETRLLIGDVQDGRTYLMREGVPAVLSVKTSALGFLNLDYAQIMDRLVWLYNISQVRSLTIEHAGRTDVLEIQDGKHFSFNGASAEEQAGRALYRSVISLEYDGRAEGSAVHSAPECRMVIELNDGRADELTLYALNERHLELIRGEESTGFYVNKSGLQNILNALEALYGEE